MNCIFCFYVAEISKELHDAYNSLRKTGTRSLGFAEVFNSQVSPPFQIS